MGRYSRLFVCCVCGQITASDLNGECPSMPGDLLVRCVTTGWHYVVLHGTLWSFRHASEQYGWSSVARRASVYTEEHSKQTCAPSRPMLLWCMVCVACTL